MRLFPPIKTQLYSVVDSSRFTSSCHPRRARPHGLSHHGDSPTEAFQQCCHMIHFLSILLWLRTRGIVVNRYDQSAHQCFFSFRVCHHLAENEVLKIGEELQCPSSQIDQGCQQWCKKLEYHTSQSKQNLMLNLIIR